MSLLRSGAALLLVVVLSSCVPARCPRNFGEALITPSWSIYEGCRGVLR